MNVSGRVMEMLTRLDCTEYRYICCVVIKMMRKYGCHQTSSQCKARLCACACSFDYVSFHIHIICHWPLFLLSIETKSKTKQTNAIQYRCLGKSGLFCLLFCAQSFYVGCQKIYTHQNGTQFISQIKDEWGCRRKPSFIMYINGFV